MRKIIERDKIEHNKKTTSLYETLFHNANGYIGIRGCLEEEVPADWDTMRGTYINGFYDIIPMKQAENLCNFVEEKQTMLNVADTQTIRLIIDNETFSLDKGKLWKNTRTLNMEEGYTLREVVWESPKGKKVQIKVKRMASFSQLTLFSMEYEVTALNFTGNIKIESYHIADVTNYSNSNDPRMAAESARHLILQDMIVTNDESIAVSKTQKSNLTMCSMVVHKVQGNASTFAKKEGNKGIYLVEARVEEHSKLTLEKYSVFTDSIRYDNVVEAAKTDMEAILKNRLAYYYEKQKIYLAHFWKQTEVEIYGDEGVNQAVNFNMYQLLQSAAKDCHCNIAAKGLSGEGYEGHYFWDTEMFLLPFFILTNPDLAKMLISYRYDTLDAARENAGRLGHKRGALYPWRTITGVECSGYFPSGTAQYHINGAVAYAVVNYYLTTGDLNFIVEKGAEIIFETARLWLDVGNYSKGKFVIHDVTGPDEYTCMINNNYYTNCAAKYNMRWAAKIYELLKKNALIEKLSETLTLTEKEIDEMKNAAHNMFLPYDEELGINPQDDSFLTKPIWNLEQTPKDDFPLLLHYHPLHLYRHQVCKQADTVLAYFLFEEEDDDIMKKSYEYYEKITTHDSSLSTCVFSIVASKLGMHQKGYDYFGDSAKLDLENTHGNTKDGIHTANMGGCYMAIVNGFAGLRIKEEGVSLTPFLPKEWKGYQFEFRYQGNLMKVIVLKDEVILKLQEGSETWVTIYGKKYLVKQKIEVRSKKNVASSYL
ncbi:MAG: glycoside hydrolase family 65 protein [Velocimicrobium sp.]